MFSVVYVTEHLVFLKVSYEIHSLQFRAINHYLRTGYVAYDTFLIYIQLDFTLKNLSKFCYQTFVYCSSLIRKWIMFIRNIF